MIKICLILLMSISLTKSLPIYAIAYDAFMEGVLSEAFAPLDYKHNEFIYIFNSSVCIYNHFATSNLQTLFNVLPGQIIQNLTQGLDKIDINKLDLGMDALGEFLAIGFEILQPCASA